MKPRKHTVASRPNRISAIVVADAPKGLHATVSITLPQAFEASMPPVPGDPAKPDTGPKPGPYPEPNLDPYPRPSPPERPDIDPDPTPEPSPDPHPAPYPAPDPEPVPSPSPGTIIELDSTDGKGEDSTGHRNGGAKE